MIDPDALNAFTTVAVSVAEPPIETPAEAWVEIDGEACETTTDSLGSPHAPAAGLFVASPE